MEPETLLTDVEFQPVPASAGKRFLNYLIDLIIFYLLCFLLGMLFAQQIYEMRAVSSEPAFTLKLELIALLVLILYYCVCEIVFKGRTIGKFITGTKAVNEDGTLIDANTALLRTLSRIVPFEPFSAFSGRPWHDKWTHTYVIDIKKTEQNNFSIQ
ncbi:RDD family protein [Parafilimonas sp.]|uniref:RDD family protein n=1 Tax=Parafilimonas sp. TaxID=1969739 RepID=UPI0039E3CFF0